MPPEAVPSNASVASTGKGIRYIGNHCYAFSGAVGALDSEQTVLDFTTGSGYIVATLTMTGPFQMSTGAVGAGFVRGYQLDFNSQNVGQYKTETADEDMPTALEVQILIPPFTAVVLVCVDSGADAGQVGTVNITGRVYD